MSELVRFRRMFEHDAWANGAVLDALRLGPAPAKARSWIAHIVGSERLWLARIRHDILSHVLRHSHYHRGQIASAVREAGGTPAYTDFIHAVRTGLIE